VVFLPLVINPDSYQRRIKPQTFLLQPLDSRENGAEGFVQTTEAARTKKPEFSSMLNSTEWKPS
jgi:hypothetical protein